MPILHWILLYLSLHMQVFLAVQCSNVIISAQFFSRVWAEKWLRQICRGKMMPQLCSHAANFCSSTQFYS